MHTRGSGGGPESLQTPDGTVLIKDVGRIVFATTFDFNAPEDEQFVSSEVVSISGPHPEADSDFELFCETVIDALT